MKKKILIVDDMAVFREPIAAALRAKGFEVFCAENGREALELVKSNGPDLILLDVAMPVMDGLQYLQAVKDDTTIPRPPVILLTAVAEKDYVITAAKLGVKEYLLKSQFSLVELLERINRYLAEAEAAPAVVESTDQSAEAGTEKTVPTSPSASTVADAATALKVRKLIMTRSEVLAKLKACGELKAFSPAVARVLKLTQSDRSSMGSIAGAIKQDQSMAIKVLKMANSAVYTRGEPVQTVEKAVVRIGLSQIRQVMLNISVVDQFGEVSIGAADAGQFWEHSLACGIIAAEIAHARSPEEADLAFTMGLVHDIGRIVFVQQFPDAYAGVLKAADELKLPLEQVESGLLQLNHADSMNPLLHAWKFPRELIDPIVLHHQSVENIQRLAPLQVTEVATLALANRLCHALALGSSGNETLYPTEQFCELLDLDAGVIRQIEEAARRETEDLKLCLLAESMNKGWVERRQRYQEAMSAPLRPLYVSSRPALDAFRIFCDQLAEQGDGPPNLGVVHLAGAAERSDLSHEYAEAETRAGARGLPLIVLSPGGNLALDDDVMRNRHHQALPTPVSVSRFLDAINSGLAASPAAAAAAA